MQEEEKRKPKPMRLMTKTRAMYPPQPPPDDEPESSTTGTSVWSRKTPPSPTPTRRGWRGGGGPSGPSDPDTEPSQGYPTTSGGETTGTEAETDVSRPIHLKFTAEAEDIFPMKPFTPHTETETETGYSSQPSRKPFHRRRLPTVTKRKFLRYQKQRAKEDKKAAAPVVQAQPQIIILATGHGLNPSSR